MRLFLLRSAEAVAGKKDARRKLADNGVHALEKLTNFLSKKDLSDITAIRHSSLTRAKQTTKQFKKLSGIKAKAQVAPLLEPLADFRILADFIESSEETLLLVGHQYNLGRLGSYLLTRESDSTLLDLKPGGMACLKAADIRDSSGSSGRHWQLLWQLRPKMLG